MALNKTYFENNNRALPEPIPDTPSYTPAVVPEVPIPTPGDTPNIERPVFTGTSSSVVLYHSTAEDRIVDKSSYLTSVYSCDITVKSSTDLIDPTIYIENPGVNIMNCNYMQVFGRYYYIREKTLISGNRYAIVGHEDVLYTFKDAILTQEGIIARQENVYNLYLDDEKYKVTGQAIERTLLFSESPLTKQLQYVLLTTGGRNIS